MLTSDVLIPLQELPECGSAMAVLRFFLGLQFGKSFLNGWEVKQRIIAKSVLSARGVDDYTFRLSAEGLNGFPIASGDNHAYESGYSLLGRNLLQFAKQARIIGFVVGVAVRQMRFVGSISGRMHAGSTAESIDFETGIVRQDEFSWRVAAVTLGFFARIRLESFSVFYDRGQGREVGEGSDLNSQGFRGASKVSQLAGIRGSDENSFGHFKTGSVTTTTADLQRQTMKRFLQAFDPTYERMLAECGPVRQQVE